MYITTKENIIPMEENLSYNTVSLEHLIILVLTLIPIFIDVSVLIRLVICEFEKIDV